MTVITSTSQNQIDLTGYERLKRAQARRRSRTERALHRDQNPVALILWVRKWKSAFQRHHQQPRSEH